MNLTRRLLVFTRYPIAGQTKTRLIPALGDEGAAMLQKNLTEKIMQEARLLEQTENIPTTVFYLGGSSRDIREWLKPQECRRQADGDLGEKMQNAFLHAFSSGITAAILVGSDIPGITAALLRRGFGLLQHSNLVIGPSLDGGYYLIGMNSEHADLLLPLLFDGVAWSTAEVYASTISRLRGHQLRIAALPPLQDIDTPEQFYSAKQAGLL